MGSSSACEMSILEAGAESADRSLQSGLFPVHSHDNSRALLRQFSRVLSWCAIRSTCTAWPKAIASGAVDCRCLRITLVRDSSIPPPDGGLAEPSLETFWQTTTCPFVLAPACRRTDVGSEIVQAPPAVRGARHCAGRVTRPLPGRHDRRSRRLASPAPRRTWALGSCLCLPPDACAAALLRDGWLAARAGGRPAPRRPGAEPAAAASGHRNGIISIGSLRRREG